LETVRIMAIRARTITIDFAAPFFVAAEPARRDGEHRTERVAGPWDRTRRSCQT